jgi:hypothetical protein
MNAPELLTPAEVVALLKDAVTEKTLENWRAAKRGPPFTTVGRKPRYPLDALNAWLESRLCSSNAANADAENGPSANTSTLPSSSTEVSASPHKGPAKTGSAKPKRKRKNSGSPFDELIGSVAAQVFGRKTG